MSIRRKIILLIVFLIFLSANAVQVSAQERMITPTGIQTRITQVDNTKFPEVTVYISVTDANGEPLHASPSQIVLYEDGQRITPDRIHSSGDIGALTALLIMDVSGSMNSNNKLDAAKAAAQAFVEQARPSDLIGLVSFNTKVEYVEPLTTDHQAVIQSIQKLKASEDTAMYDALSQGVDIIQRQPGRVAIIVLTDGLDNRSKISPQELLNRIGPGGLSISAIGLGDPTQNKTAISALDERALKALAERAGGGYGFADDEASLRSLYERYGRALQSEYVITYTSPSTLRDGVNRRLSVSLELESGETIGAVATPVSYNPGGLVPEVAQPASWIWFFILLGGLVLLLVVPLVIGRIIASRGGPDKGNKHVRLGPKIKLRN